MDYCLVTGKISLDFGGCVGDKIITSNYKNLMEELSINMAVFQIAINVP